MEAALPTTEPIPALVDGSCQVWWALPGHARPSHVALLSDAERERRGRLLRRGDQDRLTVAYALARLVLAAHLRTAPAAIRFERTCLHCGGPHGKPRLPGGELRFSLTHSGDRVALAVTRHAEVGVDVEQLKPDLDVDGLALSVLSDAEAAELAATPATDRVRAFLTYWTRKEAVVKATGEGLQVPLRDLTVAGIGTPARVHAWTGRPEAPAIFQLHDLHTDASHLACLAAIDHPQLAVREYDATALLGSDLAGEMGTA